MAVETWNCRLCGGQEFNLIHTDFGGVYDELQARCFKCGEFMVISKFGEEQP